MPAPADLFRARGFKEKEGKEWRSWGESTRRMKGWFAMLGRGEEERGK